MTIWVPRKIILSNRRRSERKSNRRLEILLLGHQCELINYSSNGVYLKVNTNDTKAFPIGTTIPLEINAITQLFDGVDENFLISGRAKVIRNSIIENPDNINSLGVALEFT